MHLLNCMVYKMNTKKAHGYVSIAHELIRGV